MPVSTVILLLFMFLCTVRGKWKKSLVTIWWKHCWNLLTWSIDKYLRSNNSFLLSYLSTKFIKPEIFAYFALQIFEFCSTISLEKQLDANWSHFSDKFSAVAHWGKIQKNTFVLLKIKWCFMGKLDNFFIVMSC